MSSTAKGRNRVLKSDSFRLNSSSSRNLFHDLPDNVEGTGAANSNGTRTNSTTPTIRIPRLHRPHPFFQGIKLFVPPLQGLFDVFERGPGVANELSNVFWLAVAVQSETSNRAARTFQKSQRQ
jgi:hypothetical protein